MNVREKFNRGNWNRICGNIVRFVFLNKMLVVILALIPTPNIKEEQELKFLQLGFSLALENIELIVKMSNYSSCMY